MRRGTDPGVSGLRARRDALLAEVRALTRRAREDEEALLLAERDRHVREEQGLDSAGAHLRGLVRDLARSLDEENARRSRALRNACDLAIRLESMEARRRSLEAFLARIHRVLPGDGA